MVLNPALYAVLRSEFGHVRINNAGVKRLEVPEGKGYNVLQVGESYDVNCPICGDQKQRLSVSYLWLEKPPLSSLRRTELAHCYNENCPVRFRQFWEPILDKVELAKLTCLPTPRDDTPVEIVRPSKVRLPIGVVPLLDLPEDHPAIVFVKTKYPHFSIDMLSNKYGVGYLDEADPFYRLSAKRLVFPITEDKEVVAWQGRTIVGAEPRWYLPPGMTKTVYNLDKLTPTDIPIINEGIPACIASGSSGVCLFGKDITSRQLELLSSKHQTVLVATDPDTFLPNPKLKNVIPVLKLKEQLSLKIKNVYMIKWPDYMLKSAEQYLAGNGNKLDAADIAHEMSSIIKDSL